MFPTCEVKMDFIINTPITKPAILEAQSMKNNGGGGNLGYFQRERKKKKGKDEIDFFEKEDEKDEFVSGEAEEEKLSDKIKGIIGKIKKKPKNNESNFFKYTNKKE